MFHINGLASGFFWDLPAHLFTAFGFHLSCTLCIFCFKYLIYMAMLFCLNFCLCPLYLSISFGSILLWLFLHAYPFGNVLVLKPDIPSALLDSPVSSSSASVTLSSSILLHPPFSSSPPAALHLSVEHRYLFRNLSVEIILHLRRSLSTHNYHGQSCRTALNSSETLMTLLAAGPSFHWR